MWPFGRLGGLPPSSQGWCNSHSVIQFLVHKPGGALITLGRCRVWPLCAHKAARRLWQAKSGLRLRRRDAPPSCVDYASRFSHRPVSPRCPPGGAQNALGLKADGLQARPVLSGDLPPAPWVGSRRCAWYCAPVALDHGSPRSGPDSGRFNLTLSPRLDRSPSRVWFVWAAGVASWYPLGFPGAG